MPGMTGLELQDALEHAGHTVPVVFISGHGDIPASVKAMKAGAIDFLTKPVQNRELLQAIEQALARGAAARAEQAERDAARGRLAQLPGKSAGADPDPGRPPQDANVKVASVLSSIL